METLDTKDELAAAFAVVMIRLDEREHRERKISRSEVKKKSIYDGPVQEIEGVSHKSHSPFACGGRASDSIDLSQESLRFWNRSMREG